MIRLFTNQLAAKDSMDCLLAEFLRNQSRFSPDERGSVGSDDFRLPGSKAAMMGKDADPFQRRQDR